MVHCLLSMHKALYSVARTKNKQNSYKQKTLRNLNIKTKRQISLVPDSVILLKVFMLPSVSVTETERRLLGTLLEICAITIVPWKPAVFPNKSHRYLT